MSQQTTHPDIKAAKQFRTSIVRNNMGKKFSFVEAAKMLKVKSQHSLYAYTDRLTINRSTYPQRIVFDEKLLEVCNIHHRRLSETGHAKSTKKEQTSRSVVSVEKKASVTHRNADAVFPIAMFALNERRKAVAKELQKIDDEINLMELAATR